MSTPRRVTFVFPGPPETRTGGFGYDRRIVAELRSLGWAVDVRILEGEFPEPSDEARAAAAEAFAAFPTGHLAIVDGLAFSALPDEVGAHASRVAMVALVHHPLALEPPEGDRHPDTDARRTRFADAERRALRHARVVVATSPHTVSTLAADYGVPPRRLHAIVPGTDPAPRARHPGEGGKLLAVGSLAPRKGQDVLLRAFARAAGRHDATLTLVGAPRDAGYAAVLHELAAELGLGSQVRLAGAATDAELEAAWGEAAAFVSASWHEGYGMAHAEALARGLPVITTAAGAVVDVVPEDAGLRVPVGDVDALADALARFLEDGALRARLVRGAIDAGRALPSWAASGEAFAGVLSELAAA